MLTRISRQFQNKSRALIPQMRRFLVPVRPTRALGGYQGFKRLSTGTQKFYKSDKAGSIKRENIGFAKEYLNFLTMQEGLIYPSTSAIFATFFIENKSDMKFENLRSVLTQINQYIKQEVDDKYASITMAVNMTQWLEMCDNENIKPPLSMQVKYEYTDPQTKKVIPGRSAIFQKSQGVFDDTQGTLWFHIKGDCYDVVAKIFKKLRTIIQNEKLVAQKIVDQYGNSRTQNKGPQNAKVLGCRFHENLNIPTDPVNIHENIIIGDQDPGHEGGSYVVAQRFNLNWEQLHMLGPEQIEDLVGRKVGDTLLPTRDHRAHIRSSRAQDHHGNTILLLRLGLPFGKSEYLNTDQILINGGNKGDEKGIYFVGYCRSAERIETILNQQIGLVQGFMRDRLLSTLKSDLGGLFYVPSLKDFNIPVDTSVSTILELKGVDWDRIDRFFRDRSKNGRMFYNHKDYMYKMATCEGEEYARLDPPSIRVLTLLGKTFELWADTWYFNRKQQELKHLQDYLEEYYPEKKEEVMKAPVSVRMGWNMRVSLGKVFTNEEYGKRGSCFDKFGNRINGADTYHIEPQEIIVGGLPNLSFGQGRYVVDYTTQEEKSKNYLRSTVTYASGVGHVVPEYQEMLRLGVPGMIEKVKAMKEKVEDTQKKNFYEGVIQSLIGVQEYLEKFADLAVERQGHCTPSETSNINNLKHIENRLRNLAKGPPTNFVEAAQLVFTLHTALHLVGEPVSVGRLDRLLGKFFEADHKSGKISVAEAQEVIDCFWIKMGEKTLLNRMYVEDHQPLGNLAMGGAAGPYPQGGSINQWGQQLTVGGIDDEGNPFHNEVTKMCLKAAKRIPVNAPCLSLRVHKDTPDELIQLSAQAILAGGAHPIFLNDDKIIPALVKSGDNIGGNAYHQDPEWQAKMDSKVQLEHARHYACDGCYEPMMVGKNWFTLGGFPTLTPLECTLNQGRTYFDAGTYFLTGMNYSFNSRPANQIHSFQDLYKLYFEHYKYLIKKQLYDQVGLYGTMAAICPSPLLSVFYEDCLEKGLDFYGGGPRYNVYGPCLTSMPSTINALWAIKKMVFDGETAVTSLPELLECLQLNWGHNMSEPFYSSLLGEARLSSRATRFKDLREIALKMDKYGRGNADIDQFGDTFLQHILDHTIAVFTEVEPGTPMADRLKSLSSSFSGNSFKFGGIQIQPGTGTFENYLEFGGGLAASADGRLKGQTISSDLSPTPSPMDREPEPQYAKFEVALKGVTGASGHFPNGSPVDFKIQEEFDIEKLKEMIKLFARGEGANVLTITCANNKTYEKAVGDPEKYDIVRNRMGGWSEFFVTMFPDHQKQHIRRPISLP